MTLINRNPQLQDTWFGDLPVTSRYTYGIAGENFYRSIKENGQLLGTYCPSCNRLYVPPTLYCERCFAELSDWKNVGNTGIVHTFTFLYETMDGQIAFTPQIIAMIKIGDGGIIHRLGEILPQEIQIGMQVVAKLKPPKERIGAITDIEYFHPVK